MTALSPTAADIEDLCVDTASANAILEDVSLQLKAGEALGLVGESGSGKTTLALSLLHYAQRGARFESGEITILEHRDRAGSKAAARAVRGKLVSYVPQNPGSALNPSQRVGDAVLEVLRERRPDLNAEEARRSTFEAVGLASTPEVFKRYPHQMSGGQQQRVCIALALVSRPPIIVLDEPTTGLDVVTQAAIVKELQALKHGQGTSMIYVSHDLAVVGQVADRIAVMYAGRIVETGPTAEILRDPKHPYTQGLLESIPDHLTPRVLHPVPGVAVGIGERPSGCRFAPRCHLRTDACTEAVPQLRRWSDTRSVRCLRPEDVNAKERDGAETWVTASEGASIVLQVSKLRAVHKSRSETVVAAESVDLTVAAGSCVALVGESGSGKTTIARAIAGLHPSIEAGEMLLGGEALAPSARRRSREQRRQVQLVFQNPADALNPKQTIRSSIARPASLLRGLSGAELDAEVNRLIELVRLPAGVLNQYPAELSGGERQRVGIARALAADPKLMICDEITSALDVSVQAAVLELLRDLVDRLNLAVLFITHDLGVVASIAQEVLVLSLGHVVESGPTRDVLKHPQHEYTKRLLEAAPSVSTLLRQLEHRDPGSVGLESAPG